MSKKEPKAQKFIQIALMVVFFLVILGFFWIISQKITFPGIENDDLTMREPIARGFIITLEPHVCDFSYLGTFYVPGYGKMELNCENGVYHGEIDDIFSIAMTELRQAGYFNAVFCIDAKCMSQAVFINGEILQDMAKMNLYMEREP